MLWDSFDEGPSKSKEEVKSRRLKSLPEQLLTAMEESDCSLTATIEGHEYIVTHREDAEGWVKAYTIRFSEWVIKGGRYGSNPKGSWETRSQTFDLNGYIADMELLRKLNPDYL